VYRTVCDALAISLHDITSRTFSFLSLIGLSWLFTIAQYDTYFCAKHCESPLRLNYNCQKNHIPASLELWLSLFLISTFNEAFAGKKKGGTILFCFHWCYGLQCNRLSRSIYIHICYKGCNELGLAVIAFITRFSGALRNNWSKSLSHPLPSHMTHPRNRTSLPQQQQTHGRSH
jgi:hypothetical protein